MNRSMFLMERDRINAMRAIRNRAVGGPVRCTEQDRLRNDARKEIESRRWDNEMGLKDDR
ncbi:hypothetical protein [Craterilacuibacter sinensis]|uniref:Uncharacterized protein n=1 Tax=Craterilacuibacter sinensis TaxID=2686017 RepID=A0A845BXC1_9NEIS|nr:hypothetical protein [Craterilacuibacter sinensis]MXR37153.1 hypothetical protein [Craterilacuibacter sinensis]RQW28944.1 hypothetical protein EHS17_03585 [Rhodobacteraceae bacterium CH30]